MKVLYHRSGGVHTAQGKVLPLAAGQATWMEVKLPGVFATAETLTPRVDDTNVIPETNELNSGASSPRRRSSRARLFIVTAA